MKSLKDYIVESDMNEAGPAGNLLDLKNPVVKALNDVCSKNGYKLQKAFLLRKQPVIVITGFGPGYHPEIHFSTLDRSPLTASFYAVDNIAGSKKFDTYLTGMQQCMNVLKAIESAKLSNLPDCGK